MALATSFVFQRPPTMVASCLGPLACAGLLMLRPAPVPRPTVLPHPTPYASAPPRARPLLCSEPSTLDEPEEPPPLPAYESSAFDLALRAILEDSEMHGIEAALDARIDQLDEMFIPMLGSKMQALEMSPGGEAAAELEQLQALLTSLQERSQERFERARDQLSTLLDAGEINKLDAQLAGLVRRDELDAGFLYVLYKNLEDANDADDEGKVRMLTHILTRTEEELEKKTEPALGLLHKLTRTDDANIRGNILRNALVPQSSVRLPDGKEVPLDPPAPAQVPPLAFATAVEGALDKVLQLPLDREVISSTVEEIRVVAKEARVVVEQSYDADTLDEFTTALTPAFGRAMSR